MLDALKNFVWGSKQRKEKIVNFLIDKPKTVYNKPDWRYSKAGMHRPGLFRMKDVEVNLFDDIFISPELNYLETVGFYHKKLMATYGIDYENVRCQINGEMVNGKSFKVTFAEGGIGATQLKFYHDFSKMKDGETQDVSIAAGKFKKDFTLTRPKFSPSYYVTLQTMIRSGFVKQKLLAEWLDYYLSCGVEHFYIYDNGINASDMRLLNSYDEITVVDWDKTSYFWMEYNLDKEKWIGVHKNQPAASTHCIQKYGRGGQSKWMIFVDPDEFLYSPTSSLLDVLKKYENDDKVAALTARSYIFAGVSPITIKSVVHDCLVREKKLHGQIKSIVKPEFVENQKVHGASKVKGKRTNQLDVDELHYNHYRHIGKWGYVRKARLREPVVDRELSDIVKRRERGLQESGGNVFDFFEGIYCINPDRNKSRWRKIQRAFGSLGIADRVERFDATENDLKYFGRKFKVGEKGRHHATALSHLEIIKTAKQKNLDNVLIFEDDAEFVDFNSKYLKSSIRSLKKLDWNLFFLGYNIKENNKARIVNVSENLFHIPPGFCKGAITSLHSYCVNKSAYDFILENYKVPTKLGDPETRSRIDSWLPNRLGAHCMFPLLSVQAFQNRNGVRQSYMLENFKKFRETYDETNSKKGVVK